MLSKKSKIFIAGHNGMVGSSILRHFKSKNYNKIYFIEKKKLNLLNQEKVFNYLKKIRPEFVILAAARVGGILANQKMKSQFLYENLQIQNNIIHGSYLSNVNNLIFLGSSCVYPKNCKQPIKEKYLLNGELEKTNDAYAIAKISGIKMCENYSREFGLNYKTLMPCNLYGPNDNYDSLSSHFFPALLKKIYFAKSQNKKILNIWGTGRSKRELLHVDDLANAIEFFLKKKIKEPYINIGLGYDRSIAWYAKFIMKKLNVNLKIKLNKKKPDGTYRKCLDIRKAKNYGWKPKISINNGFKMTLEDFIEKI
tara:strand:- start:87 stop:1016 length:930 start_codon:yes stop_codon:yes gene_type:complete